MSNNKLPALPSVEREPALELERMPPISEVRTFASIWSWPDAVPSQRASAFVLDVLIIGAVCGVLEAFVSRKYEINLPAALSIFFGYAYFVALTAIRGQTLGKMMLGVRIVPLEQLGHEDRVAFGRVFLREVIWKTLGAVCLGYGFIRILARRDHSALHDALSRTRVVSLSLQRRSSPVKIGHVIGAATLVVFGLAASSFYTVHYTTQPLKSYARSLELLGYKIGRVRGSLANGFVIDSIAQENEDYAFELKGVAFRIDEKLREGKRIYVARDVTIRRANVTVRQAPAFLDAFAVGPKIISILTKKGLVADPAPAVFDAGAREEREAYTDEPVRLRLPKFPGPVVIESIELNNLEFTIPIRPVYKIERAVVTNLEFNQEAGTLNLGRLALNSEPVTADIQNVLVQGKTISVGQSSSVQLRPSLYPEFLIAPVDLRFEGLLESGRATKVSLVAFGGKLRLKLDGDLADLSVTQFTPFHYFKTELPIWSLDFHLAGDLKELAGRDLGGSIGIRHVRLAVDGFNFVTDRAKRRYTFAPQLVAGLFGALAGREPIATLGSSDKQPVNEILSDLYYGRSFVTLSTSEREIVDHDRRYFADTPDAGKILTPAPSLPLAPVAAQRPAVERAPSADHSSGVPTKLPAFKKKR